jgi:Tfp pilus assembly protein PilF
MNVARNRYIAVTLLLVALVAPARAAQGGRSAEAKALVDRGAAALDAGDLATAREALEKALALAPKNAEVHTNLGILADHSGDLERASREFAEAVRLAPSAATHNNYGVILLRLGHASEAAAQLEASLRLDPKQPNALVNLSQIRFAAGTPADLRAAADLLSKAFAIVPDVEIARALTVVALRLDDPKAAAAHYADYSALLARQPDAPVAAAASRAELGAALREAGLADAAKIELTAVVTAEPSNVEAINELARAYLALGDVPAAGRTLEGAVARGVDAAPVYALLAEVYEKAGHPENAIPAMRLAIERDPASEKYRFGYGLLLMNAYAPAAAVIRLEEALKAFPDSPRLWFALGLAYFKYDRDDESAKALQHALQLDPKFAPALAYLGMVRVKGGAYEEAVRLYGDALRIDPKLAVVHYLVAEAMLQTPSADPAAVESHLKQVVAADPTFVPAHVSLAKVLIRGQRWAEAAVELEKAVSIDPNGTEAYYHLGRVYARLKRTEDAKAAAATFERLSATQKEREHDELQQIVRRLADVRF